ncbi:hypothetical protein [Prosthecochloris sp. GSB1]|uniref:hypothetical protein n=1 Tax=Prosthecochloris sp. GSB1 TaxID=281093 RepID=UPI0012948651|nr:hypothetical protein [Prosthecochloris sp. GSB1]
MNYLVSAWLVYASLMFLHNLFTPGRKAKVYLLLDSIAILVALGIILSGLV